MTHLILGATGHVGSAVAKTLLNKGENVIALVRNEEKAGALKGLGAEVLLTDIRDVQSLKNAFSKGDSLFLIVPPFDPSGNAPAQENEIIDHYVAALEGSAVERIVALSTGSAHLNGDIGMLALGRRTEEEIGKLPVKTSFVRPAYYYTNWDMALDTAKSKGVVHTMFPPDMQVTMISPKDIGEFIAGVMLEAQPEKVYEIGGPQTYSSNDVAEAFTAVLERDVTAVETKQDSWVDAYKGMGFSDESAHAFAAMTGVVVSGRGEFEHPEKVHKMSTTLQEHISHLAKD